MIGSDTFVFTSLLVNDDKADHQTQRYQKKPKHAIITVCMPKKFTLFMPNNIKHLPIK